MCNEVVDYPTNAHQTTAKKPMVNKKPPIPNTADMKVIRSNATRPSISRSITFIV